MSEILGDLIDGGEWRFADDSELPAEPAILADEAVQLAAPAAIEGLQEAAQLECVLTPGGQAILPRVIGRTGPNLVVRVPSSLLPVGAVPRIIGEVERVQRTPGPRQQAVLEIFAGRLVWHPRLSLSICGVSAPSVL